MSTKTRTALATIGVAVIIATGITAGTASAASAPTEKWDDCESGHVCLWDDPGFGGDKLIDWQPHRRFELYNFPDAAANRASSIRNNSHFNVRIHNLRNANGFGRHCFRPQSGHGDLNLLGLDNAARSATTPPRC